jgi:hypothetical protein
MDLQSLAVGVIIGAAAVYLGRMLWRSAKGEGEGHCEKCGEMKEPGKR